MLIDDIKKHEGFASTVYKDSLGFDTIGYGTKLPLTEEECELLLRHRLGLIIIELKNKMPLVEELPEEKQDILFNMAYNMGVNRLLGFKRMWKALQKFDYNTASREMIDSIWYNQVGKRAKELADRMKE